MTCTGRVTVWAFDAADILAQRDALRTAMAFNPHVTVIDVTDRAGRSGGRGRGSADGTTLERRNVRRLSSLACRCCARRRLGGPSTGYVVVQ